MNENFLSTVAYAIETGNTQLFDFLLKDFDSLDKETKNEILDAAVRKAPSADFLQHVFDYGYDLSYKDKFGFNLLHIAVANSTKEIVHFLIQKGFDINELSNFGDNAISIAASFTEHVDVIEELLNAGADINTINKEGETLLSASAAYNPNPKITQFFIDKGLDIEARDKDSFTPLLNAAYHQENTDVIDVLTNAGADINATTDDGRTMYHLAAYNSNPNVVRFISFAFFPSMVDNDGISCFTTALLSSTSPQVMKLYLQRLKEEHLKFACLNPNAEILEVLIQNDYDINAADSDGVTTLMRAANGNTNPDIIRMLVYYNAIWNCTDSKGRTVLHYAAANTDPAIYNWMTEEANDPSADFKSLAEIKDNLGNTADYYLTHKEEF